MSNLKTLVSRKQVNKKSAAKAQTVMASVYRTAKRNGFDYTVSITRSERNAKGVMANVASLNLKASSIDSLVASLTNGVMTGIESLNLKASSIDSLIAELQATKAIIKKDLAAKTK